MESVVFFWDDLWFNRVPRQSFPELFSFARNPHISVFSALSADGPSSLFHLPIAHEALQQLTLIVEDLNELQGTNDKDFWTYIWGSHHFSSSKVYKQLTGHRVIHKAFKWLWKTSCQNKHKVFYWLLLKDRLSTRELLKRRNMELPNYSCVCCALQLEESITHLFIHCPFAHDCWALLGLLVRQEIPLRL